MMTGAESIRDVIASPKTQPARYHFFARGKAGRRIAVIFRAWRPNDAHGDHLLLLAIDVLVVEPVGNTCATAQLDRRQIFWSFSVSATSSHPAPARFVRSRAVQIQPGQKTGQPTPAGRPASARCIARTLFVTPITAERATSGPQYWRCGEPTTTSSSRFHRGTLRVPRLLRNAYRKRDACPPGN